MAAGDGADHDDRARRAGADPRAARVRRSEGAGRAGRSGSGRRRSSPRSCARSRCVDGGLADRRRARTASTRSRARRSGRVRPRRPAAARRARRARTRRGTCAPTCARFADGSGRARARRRARRAGRGGRARRGARRRARRAAGWRAAAVAVVAVVGPAGHHPALAGRGGRGPRRAAAAGRGDLLATWCSARRRCGSKAIRWWSSSRGARTRSTCRSAAVELESLRTAVLDDRAAAEALIAEYQSELTRADEQVYLLEAEPRTRARAADRFEQGYLTLATGGRRPGGPADRRPRTDARGNDLGAVVRRAKAKRHAPRDPARSRALGRGVALRPGRPRRVGPRRARRGRRRVGSRARCTATSRRACRDQGLDWVRDVTRRREAEVRGGLPRSYRGRPIMLGPHLRRDGRQLVRVYCYPGRGAAAGRGGPRRPPSARPNELSRCVPILGATRRDD